jgi:hypothetical protein
MFLLPSLVRPLLPLHSAVCLLFHFYLSWALLGNCLWCRDADFGDGGEDDVCPTSTGNITKNWHPGRTSGYSSTPAHNGLTVEKCGEYVQSTSGGRKKCSRRFAHRRNHERLAAQLDTLHTDSTQTKQSIQEVLYKERATELTKAYYINLKVLFFLSSL